MALPEQTVTQDMIDGAKNDYQRKMLTDSMAIQQRQKQHLAKNLETIRLNGPTKPMLGGGQQLSTAVNINPQRQDLSNRWGTGLKQDDSGGLGFNDGALLDRAIQDGSAIPLGQVGGVPAPVPMRDTNMGMIDKPMVSGANPTSDTRMMSGAGINTYSRQPAQPANPVNRQTGNVPFFPRMMSNPIQQTLGGGQDFSNMHPAFRQQMPNTGFLTAAMAPVHQIMQQRFNAPMPQNYGQWK